MIYFLCKLYSVKRIHSSRMCTVLSSSHLSRGVCLSACLDTNPPGPDPQDQAPPLDQTPRDQAPPWKQTPRPGIPPGQTPLGPGTPLYGKTDTCKNITFATSLRTVKKVSMPSYILYPLLPFHWRIQEKE